MYQQILIYSCCKIEFCQIGFLNQERLFLVSDTIPALFLVFHFLQKQNLVLKRMLNFLKVLFHRVKIPFFEFPIAESAE